MKDATKIDRNKRGVRDMAARTRAILADRFPDCFAGKGEEKRPLKIGIGTDILLAMPELEPFPVAVALADYTFGPTYARLCTEGATRIGLDGAPVGIVSAAEAEHARRRLHLFTRKSSQDRAGRLIDGHESSELEGDVK